MSNMVKALLVGFFMVVNIKAVEAHVAMIPGYQTTAKWHDTCPVKKEGRNKNVHCVMVAKKWICWKTAKEKATFIARLGTVAIARSNGKKMFKLLVDVPKRQADATPLARLEIAVVDAYNRVVHTPVAKWSGKTWEQVIIAGCLLLISFLGTLLAIIKLGAKVGAFLFARLLKRELKEEDEEKEKVVVVEAEVPVQAVENHYHDERRIVHEYHMHVHVENDKADALVPVVDKLIQMERPDA